MLLLFVERNLSGNFSNPNTGSNFPAGLVVCGDLEAMLIVCGGFRAGCKCSCTGSEEQERHAGAAAIPFAPPPHPKLSHGSIRA